MRPVRPLNVLLAGLLLAAAASASAQVPPKAVTAQRLDQAAPLQRVEIAAQVISPNDSLLSAEINAVVAAIRIDVGARVERGQVLLELDATDARLALRQAEAQLAAAKAQANLAAQRFKRGEELIADGFVSKDELLALRTGQGAARAEVEVRAAGLAQAQRLLNKARVLAPFDGVVVERHAQRGMLAVPGTPLLRLIDLAAPEVDAALPADLAARIDSMQAAAFVNAGTHWPLQLARLSPVVGAQTRTHVARFRFAGEAAAAGSSGRLLVTLSQRSIPAELLVQRGEATGVFVIENARARFVGLPGSQPGRIANVDLPGSTLIVVGGHQALTDGDAVQAESP